MAKNEKLGDPEYVYFGAIVDRLHKQAGVPEEVLSKEQKVHDSIVYLKVHGYITPTIQKKCFDKLSKNLEKTLQAFYRTLKESNGN